MCWTILPWQFYCRYKVPQTGWLKTMEMYCLTILEARSLKSRCQQTMLPQKTAGDVSSLSLPSFGQFHSCLWGSLACSCVTLISFLPVTWRSPHVCALTWLSLSHQSYRIRGSLCSSVTSLHLTVLSTNCISDWGHTLRYWGVRIWTYLFQGVGDAIQLITPVNGDIVWK